MLNVNNVLPTLYKDRKMKICRSDGSDRKKNSRKKKVNFQNKCALVPNKNNEGGRYRSGVSPTFSQLAVSCVFSRQAGPAAFYNKLLPNQWERVINYRKCPNYETPRFLDIHLIDSPITDEPKRIKQRCRMSLRSRLKTQECKNVMAQITTVHSLFLC